MIVDKIRDKLKARGLEKNYKIWIYKNRTIVLDIKNISFKVYLDIVFTEGKIVLLLSGRDNISKLMVNHYLDSDLECVNKYFDKKRVVKEWDINEDLDIIIDDTFNYSNAVFNLIKAVDRSTLVGIMATFHEKVVDNIKLKMSQGDNVLQIGFLVSERQKWNAQAIWDALSNKKNVSCRIYLHNYKSEQLSEQIDFFRKIDPNLVCLYDEGLKRNKSISLYDLDVVFCQQPWTGLDRQVQSCVGKSLVVYMHYGFLVYANNRMQYQKWDFFPYIWRYLSQSELQRKIHLRYDPSISDRQIVTGYPKLDVYFDIPSEICGWKESSSNKRRVIYAPHHSMKKDALKISTFSWNFNLLLDLSRVYSEKTEWVYKPHGRLRYSVVDSKIMTKKEYELYVLKWLNQINSTVYDSGNYFDLFRTSDVLITDCGSFLGEYFPTGKPIIWLQSDNSAVKLNEIGEKLSESFYKVRSKSELVDVFQRVVINGEDPLKDKRLETMNEIFPRKERSTDLILKYFENVFDFILKDYK